MQVTTVSDFRNNIKEYMNAVWENAEEVIIAGPKGRNVVVISMEEYESMKETDYLLSSPANAERLIESIGQAEKGNIITKTIEELQQAEQK